MPRLVFIGTLWIGLGAVAADARAEEAAASAAAAPGKKPQVRTYSSVTVVDDPNKAPPLPGRPAPSTPTPPSADKSDRPERGDKADRPTKNEKAEWRREVRSELRELRRSMRAEEASDREQPASAAANPDDRPKQPDEHKAAGKAAADRDPPQKLREKLLERLKTRETIDDRDEPRGAKKSREPLSERVRDRRD